MMKLYICEDIHLERTRIEEAARSAKYELKENHINDIKVYDHPDDLLKEIEGEFNIYLLDIDYGLEVTGIDLGKKIREKDYYAKIIFLTAHKELAMDTLTANIEPFSFIYKGDVSDAGALKHKLLEMFLKITDSYIRWCKELEEEEVIRISDQKQVRLIPRNKFLYLENYSRERKVKVQLTDETFFVNNYLGNMKELFDSASFYTEAQSMIINPINVEELNPQDLYIKFKSGHLIFVTKSFMKRMKKRMAVLAGGV
ncbi:LytR/AlgR family response regulator transcription factor [Enterococcus sp. BWR-S5]|uniref:LytR/AlgR family response regulator transcription factor n=1 Tax=Enterococcus sp. BWR-S5 TaxID=2787714 RepID=UPI00192203A1|nr:LytTR family DNA-binding domain-containing protein [Enterococcus sp. BWR-S5]MBL1226014.1 response regulator transcription factor [Enterococcus sp. BWR-S5]